MAKGGISQSTIPTYFDEGSTKLNGLVNNQILMCNDYSGSRRNFIVVDEASINSNVHTVQDCYLAGWIVDFPTAAKGYKEIYKIVLLGSDYDVNQAGISTGKLFIRDKSKFTIKINGTELDSAHWDFLILKVGVYHAGETDYSSSIIFDAGTIAALLPADEIEVEYIENITLGGDYHLKLYRSDGLTPRQFMIPKSGVFDGHSSYLSKGGLVNMWTVDPVYTRMDAGGNFTVSKRQCDMARIAEFATGMDLTPFGLGIEVYRMQNGHNGDGLAWSTRSAGANSKLVFKTQTNGFMFENFAGSGPNRDRIQGTYMVRVVDITGQGVSPFLQTKISIKSFPVCETNESLSRNNCVGYYFTSKLV